MHRPIKIWLWIGMMMLFVQIIVGGITRLTGSGLSITKWEIVTGTLPPVSAAAWEEEFEKYKQTPQYLKINEGMTISAFKFIYFWEYIHRLWARVMGLVFLLPFMFFLRKTWITRELARSLAVVIVLAAITATFGWIMVASGLVDRPWVNAYKLSLHLILGISVLVALLWTYLNYTYNVEQIKKLSIGKEHLGWLYFIIPLIVVQIIFGGWMSGMKAALFFPTWPLIGSEVIPSVVLDPSNWRIDNFVNYESGSFAIAIIHTFHRFTAYLLALLIIWYGGKFYLFKPSNIINKWYLGGCILLVIQVVLGIILLLTSRGSISVLWGVLHQAVAVLLLCGLVGHYFYVKKGYLNRLR